MAPAETVPPPTETPPEEGKSYIKEYLPGHRHDIPILGVLSSAVADGWSGLVGANATEEDVKEVFNKIDTNKSATLDKTDISQAMRDLGYSERQIQKQIDYLPPDSSLELTFEQFYEMVCPGGRPALHNANVMGMDVPYPNAEKIYDVPVIGNTLYMTNDIIAQPCDNMLRSAHRSFREYSDDAMEATFKKYDTKKTGHLPKKDIAKALRGWGFTEGEIKRCLDNNPKQQISQLEFKDMVRGGPKFAPSRINYIPGVGAAVDNNIQLAEDYSTEDLQERWDLVREESGMPAKLDKFEVAEVLRSLGKSTFQVQEFIEFMEEEEIDFPEFQAYMEGKPRPYLTEVGGYGVPNPAKVHDVPIIGTATKLTQDVCRDTYDWTLGACFRNFSSLPKDEVKAKFDEFDNNPKNGRLSKKELHRLMRDLGKKEWEIKRVHDQMTKKEYTFDEFKEFISVSEAAA